MQNPSQIPNGVPMSRHHKHVISCSWHSLLPTNCQMRKCLRFSVQQELACGFDTLTVLMILYIRKANHHGEHQANTPLSHVRAPFVSLNHRKTSQPRCKTYLGTLGLFELFRICCLHPSNGTCQVKRTNAKRLSHTHTQELTPHLQQNHTCVHVSLIKTSFSLLSLLITQRCQPRHDAADLRSEPLRTSGI